MREKGSGIANTLEAYLPKVNLSLDSLNNLNRIGNNHLLKNFIKDNDGIGFFFQISIGAELEAKTLCLIDVKELKIDQDFYLVYLKNTKNKAEIDQILKIFAPGQL